MPSVDFYILSASQEQARYQMACKLTAKAYQAKQTVYIHCSDAKVADQIDALLWSFDDISFIPHSMIGAANEEIPPVLIGHADQACSAADVLINLSPKIPENSHDYSRILEIVTADPTCKASCREHYKTYQAADFPLQSHRL